MHNGYTNKSYLEDGKEGENGIQLRLPEIRVHVENGDISVDAIGDEGPTRRFKESSNGFAAEDNEEEKGVEEKENKEEKDKKQKYNKSVSLLQLFKHADRLDVFLMIFGSLFAVVNGLMFPAHLVLFGKLISEFIDYDKEVQSGNVTTNIQEEMKFFAYTYSVMGVLAWLAGHVQCAFWSVSAIRQVHQIRLKFLRSIMRQNIGWFDVNEAGGLTGRMFEDLTLIQTGIGDKLGGLLQAITTLVAGLTIGFYYGWKLALVVLAVTPAIMLTGMLSSKVMSAFTSKEQTAYAAASSIAEEVISSIRTVVAFGKEKTEVKRYNEKLVIAEKAGIKKAITGGISIGAFQLVLGCCEAVAFWYGSTLVADGFIDGGELTTVFFCLMIGAIQVGQAAPNLEALATARGAAYFVYNIIDRKSQIDPLSEDGLRPDITSAEEILFQDVEFSYPSREDIKVLKGFNLSIKKGSTVALVGESGCGKSTVVKLIQRFYDSDKGTIFIGKNNIKAINVNWLRRNIGIVSQEPLLFDGTIAENIRMGRGDASQEEIEAAARDANAHEFIKQLPMGYETTVGEDGSQLSGGQKQRIAIARALIKDPQILLLDEATSALDTESESVVQMALDNASLDRTTIIIAHRLSTIKNADTIVAVKEGQVAEVGTHEQLLEQRGIYYQLVMLQTLAEKEELELTETGSILSKAEKETLLEVRIMRSLSTLSESLSPNNLTVAKELTRQLSVRLKKRAKNISKDKPKKKDKKSALEEAPVEPASITRILKYNRPELLYIMIGLIFSVIAGLIPIVFSVLLAELLKTLAIEDKKELKDEARKWSLLFIAMDSANGISQCLSSCLFGKAGEALTRRLRAMAFESIVNQDISYFDDPFNGTGQLVSKLATDASKVKGATSSRISVLVQVSATGLGALAIGFAYSWKLTLLVVAFVPFLVVGGMARASRFKNFAAKQRKQFLKASAVSNQAVMNIRTVASLSKENYFIDKFTDLVTVPYSASKKQARLYGFLFGSSRSFALFTNAAAFYLGGYLVQNEGMEFQNVFKIIIAGTFGSMVAGQMLSFTPDFLSAKVSAARLFQLFDRKPSIDVDWKDGKTKKSLSGEVSFTDVKFTYPSRPDVPVLQGLSLDINVGQKVALVGASGCGKSTTVGLLERFYDPKEGTIVIDGCEIKHFNLKWLRSQIAIVSQEPILFARSIRDNILYGVPDEQKNEVSQKIVEEVAKASNIHEFIMGLPRGYDTVVGEKGSLISGGQKQRIAIARALIRNPRILLLDEATSALDSESEKIVQEALDRAMENRTSIIIAHRLSTVQNADLIVVIQAGQVVEMGTHSELMSKRGPYWILNTTQS